MNINGRLDRSIILEGLTIRLLLGNEAHRERVAKAFHAGPMTFTSSIKSVPINVSVEGSDPDVRETVRFTLPEAEFLRAIHAVWSWEIASFGQRGNLSPAHVRRLARDVADDDVRLGLCLRPIRGHLVNAVVREYFGACEYGYDHAKNCAKGKRGVCDPCARFLESRVDDAPPRRDGHQAELFGESQ
ncbi:MAG: hypothetical protein KKH12_15915 [Gammaproteobacteria bacterium]|nr:hypothetical protein [Gammaproteobacteria bacterium]